MPKITRSRRSASAVNNAERAELTIDELAHKGQTTVRNVRAYQERGLLPSPEVRGRTGYYTESHLARLRVIGRLLERGYTLANIGELVGAWEAGRDISQLLGLEHVLTMPWSSEEPLVMSLPQLAKLFGGKFSSSDLLAALDMGIIERQGISFRVPRPQLVLAGAEIVRQGIPLRDLIKVMAGLRGNVERVAESLVTLVVDAMDRYDGELPPGEDIQALAEKIGLLRPLADKAFNAEVSRAMENALSKFLGERMAQVMDHLQANKYRSSRSGPVASKPR